MISNEVLITDYYDIDVYRDGEQLEEDVDYSFDWNLLELSTFNPFQNYTHHVGLYGDLKKIKDYYDENIKEEKLL